jgi:hypothetical protein
MDPLLREMCLNVVREEVGGEKFTSLLIESGMELDDIEWKIAARLLAETDRVMYIKETHASPTIIQ